MYHTQVFVYAKLYSIMIHFPLETKALTWICVGGTAQLARWAHLSGKGDQINFCARWYQYVERQRSL